METGAKAVGINSANET